MKLKNLLFFLLLLLTFGVFGQAPIIVKDTAYYPQYDDAGVQIRPAAFSVVKTTGYTTSKKYAMWVNVHGAGEVGQGKLENLRNVTLGFAYRDADGNLLPRQHAVASPDFLSARDQYEFLAVIPTHGGDMTPDQINYIFQQVEKDYSVDTSRRALIGFSAGGKIVTRYMSSSPANAAKIAVCVGVAPVNGVQSCKVVADAGLPFIGATVQVDPRVNSQNVRDIIACIKGQAPRIAPYYIEFPGNGHGGINEMLQLYHPLVPQNIYSFLKSVTNTDRKAYPTSTNTNPPPVTPPPSGTPILRTWYRAAVTATDTIGIKACGPLSTGYDVFNFSVISVPAGVSIWSPIVQSGGYCQTLVKFPKEGAYTIVARACKGSNCVTDTMTITYQKQSVPVPRVAVEYDGTNIIFNDASQEKATFFYNWKTKIGKAVTISGSAYIVP